MLDSGQKTPHSDTSGTGGTGGTVRAPLSRARTIAAIAALALGGFGIGSTEFAAMGVLPEITADLLPRLYAENPEVALGRASLLVSAYALGVVLGAPAIIIFAARISKRRLVFWFALYFAAISVLTALAPNFELAVLCRFLAGLPHGAYFGVAPLIAAKLMGPGKRGSGVALVLLGLTIANLAGVPLITLLGQHLGWRAAVLAIAAIFAASAAAIFFTVPADTVSNATSVTQQFRVLAQWKLWLAVAVPAFGISGFFSVYSYISPLVTEVAGEPLKTVSLILVCAGAGMTAGTLIGGKMADKDPLFALLISLILFMFALVFTAIFAHNIFLLAAGVFMCALATTGACPGAQVWISDIAHDAPVLGGALVHSAFNIANALGAAGAGVTVARGFGFISPMYFGIAMLTIALALFTVLYRREKRQKSAV